MCLSDSFLKRLSKASNRVFQNIISSKFSIDELRAFMKSDAFVELPEKKRQICAQILNPCNEVEVPPEEAWRLCRDSTLPAKVLKVLPDKRFRLVRVYCVICGGIINLVGKVKVKTQMFQPNSIIYVQPTDVYPVFIWRRDMSFPEIKINSADAENK